VYEQSGKGQHDVDRVDRMTEEEGVCYNIYNMGANDNDRRTVPSESHNDANSIPLALYALLYTHCRPTCIYRL